MYRQCHLFHNEKAEVVLTEKKEVQMHCSKFLKRRKLEVSTVEEIVRELIFPVFNWRRYEQKNCQFKAN